jgi:TetR/AcrR family transcriptional repressor of nem operon
MADIPLRETILSKAGELFHKRGYGGVSIEEVILASGLPKATFHQNFSSKAKLGNVWLERLERRMSMMHQNFLEKPGDRDRRLRKYFYSMRSWVEANGFRSCQFANTAACIDADEDEELTHLIDQYKRAQRKFFIELVGTLVPEADAQRLGTAVFLLYSGAMTEAQNLKATWPLEDALASAEQLCGIVR